MKKHLGQHFLFDPAILERIIASAQLEPSDTVVEIGPGPGRMTRMLADRVKKVIAIELDDNLYERLKDDLIGYSNIDLIHDDALEYPFENIPAFKVVANIPYYITTPIIFRLLTARKNLISMTLTVQKEVAVRIVAHPGGKDYGVLSIMIQYYGEPHLAFTISKKAFRPVPKVDSAVIHIRVLEQPPVRVSDETLFFRIIKTAFSQRRKMLLNSLKPVHQDVKTWLQEAGIDPKRRPETLSIKEFALIARTFAIL